MVVALQERTPFCYQKHAYRQPRFEISIAQKNQSEDKAGDEGKLVLPEK